MFTFNHSGKMGDLLYSLYFCKAVSDIIKLPKFNFHIQTGVPLTLNGREKDIGRLTPEGAEYIASLLRVQEYINEVTISDNFDSKNYLKSFNLDNFRKLKINFSSGSIPEWYFNLTNYSLRRNFSDQLIKVLPNKDFAGKIILFRTRKYINPFVSLKPLLDYKDKVVFIGLEKEWDIVKNILPGIEYYQTKSGLDTAQAIRGSRVVVSNQNGNFAIAELMKANRILIPAQYEIVGKNHDKLLNGPTNVICYGGWFENVNSTEKITNILKLVMS